MGWASQVQEQSRAERTARPLPNHWIAAGEFCKFAEKTSCLPGWKTRYQGPPMRSLRYSYANIVAADVKRCSNPLYRRHRDDPHKTPNSPDEGSL